MSTEFDAIKDELAKRYVAGGYGCDGDTSADSFIKGFDAALKLCRDERDKLLVVLKNVESKCFEMSEWFAYAESSGEMFQEEVILLKDYIGKALEDTKGSGV